MLRLLKVSGFARGATAALAVLGLLPQLLPYDVLDLVAGLHALLVGWNTLAGAIGAFIGQILRLPEIPPEIVSAAVIALTVGPAWSFSIFASERGQHKGALQIGAYSVRIVVAFLEAMLWATLFVLIPPNNPFFYGALFSLLIMFSRALVSLPRFRAGFLTALGFLAVVEGIYLASTERVQAAFDGFVCEHQQAGAPRCQAE